MRDINLPTREAAEKSQYYLLRDKAIGLILLAPCSAFMRGISWAIISFYILNMTLDSY